MGGASDGTDGRDRRPLAASADGNGRPEAEE